MKRWTVWVHRNLICALLCGAGASVAAEATALAEGDPADEVKHGWCNGNFTWNGTTARLYWPTDSTCSESIADSPMVVMLRGNGFAHTDYHYLMRHLARNGFIAASIDVVSADDDSAAAHQEAADKAWSFVEDFMWTAWSKRFYIDPDAVALIGHSRGGETARFLASSLADHPVFRVRAVVGMAPTGDLDHFVDGGDAHGMLLLYGSEDSDVPPHQVYRHFDRAGANGSQSDPFWSDQIVERAMKLLPGAGHAGFIDSASPLVGAAQREATQGYVLAFLAEHIAGDASWYDDFVRGDTVPGSWSSGVLSQYRDGFLRRVIDTFENGGSGVNTLGGTVSATSAFFAEGSLSPPQPTPHEAQVAYVIPGGPAARVDFTLPSGKRDLSAFKHISLRIGGDFAEAPEDVFVQLGTTSGDSPMVRLSDHGQIAPRMSMCTVGVAVFCIAHDDLVTLSTVRVPLDALGPHDNVTRVRLRFGSDAVGSTFVIDDLEASEWIHNP